MEHLQKQLTAFGKSSILDIWQCPESVFSFLILDKYFLCITMVIIRTYVLMTMYYVVSGQRSLNYLYNDEIEICVNV